MTALELKAEIKKEIDNLSEKNLTEIFMHLQQLQKEERLKKNARKILDDNKELFERLAK